MWITSLLNMAGQDPTLHFTWRANLESWTPRSCSTC